MPTEAKAATAQLPIILFIKQQHARQHQQSEGQTSTPASPSLHVQYLQAVQDAVLRSGVAHRLGPRSEAGVAEAPSQPAGMRGSTTSPRSTITLKADLGAEQQTCTPTAGRAPAVQSRRSNRSEGDTEVKQLSYLQQQLHVAAN
jgi:hypothetical protein